MTETDFRRITAGTAVLLLHLALLSAFLVANYAQTVLRNPIAEIEIRFVPRAAEPNPGIPPTLQPRFLRPTAPVLPTVPGQLYAPQQESPPAAGAIAGVGRALFGCDPQTLDLLSPQDRAKCLRPGQRRSSVAAVRMPPAPDPNSPFTKEIEERFREATPINRPCPLGSFNDTHGLPCFGFTGDSPVYPPQ